jgi:hypothetical protein
MRDRAAGIAADIEAGPNDRLNRRRRRWSAHWHIGGKNGRGGQRGKSDDADRDPHWLMSLAPPK